jgi:hypothetical protein
VVLELELQVAGCATVSAPDFPPKLSEKNWFSEPFRIALQPISGTKYQAKSGFQAEFSGPGSAIILRLSLKLAERGRFELSVFFPEKAAESI